MIQCIIISLTGVMTEPVPHESQIQPSIEQFKIVKEVITGLLQKDSKISTDSEHMLDTVTQLLCLEPNADIELQTAALLHDIDRGYSPREKLPEETYDQFKDDHAYRSALLTRSILEMYKYPKEAIERIAGLVLLHETGGEGHNDQERYQKFTGESGQIPNEVLSRAKLLMDADSISFFNTGLVWYAANRPSDMIVNKIVYSYTRAGKRAQKIIDQIMQEHQNKPQYLEAMEKIQSESKG